MKLINLDDKKSKGTHIFTHVYKGTHIIAYILQGVLNKIKDKSITYNVFRIQDNDSIMCGFYCITFIEYMLKFS